jgi:hypothetical protein
MSLNIKEKMTYFNLFLIPYRDRQTHLKVFLEEVVPLIEKHMPETKIVILEQSIGKPFNRGKLLNIGVHLYNIESLKFIFLHDVDQIPTPQTFLDTYVRQDFDLVKIKVPHANSLGCIVKMAKHLFVNSNGFPNMLWGWGIEDRALDRRVKHASKTMSVLNMDTKNSFKNLPHRSNVRTLEGFHKKYSDLIESVHTKGSEFEKQKLTNSSGLNTVLHEEGGFKIISKTVVSERVERILLDL